MYTRPCRAILSVLQNIFYICQYNIKGMGRAPNFNRETIIAAGLQLVREQGESALTARALGKVLGCSTSPLFTVCGSFEDVRKEVKNAAMKEFCEYVRDSVNYIPAFKEFGIRLVRYSVREPNLFKLIFLTPGTGSDLVHPDISEYIEAMKETYGINDEQVCILFEQVWTYACGLTVISVAGGTSFTDDQISDRLSRQFAATIMYIKSGLVTDNLKPRLRKEGESAVMPLF